MNKEGMSKMNRFLIIIAIILMIIVVCLALGIYYVKSTNNSDWSLPKYSISGNAVYEYENPVSYTHLTLPTNREV